MTTENKIEEAARWEPTRYANLFRYVPSGTIYARFKVGGKQVRKSLKTPMLELAKNKLAELERNERAITQERRLGKMTFGEALKEHIATRKCDPTIKPGTKDYDDQRCKALYLSWAGLEALDVRRVSREECQRWAESFAHNFSGSTYNHTIALVKHAFEVAVERGVRYDNPAKCLKRQTERPKKLTLPTCDQFAAFVREIESGGSGKSEPCANLVRFFAFSGLRKSEAANILWSDVNFDKGVIRVHGDPKLRTKNGDFRSVPILPEMRTLLLRLRAAEPDPKPEDPVMAVRECQKAMNRAAEIVGMARITHHDLRHLFATHCIESGVDILTVSRWLGHKDGGGLAMRTYGHLRDEHSQAMAQKVYFSVEARKALTAGGSKIRILSLHARKGIRKTQTAPSLRAV